MGGNTYINRRRYTEVELIEIVNRWAVLNNKLHSAFEDKVFDTYARWRANLSRHLDAESCRRFLFLVAEITSKVPTCNNSKCNKPLTYDSFTYIQGVLGFRKYCPECMSKEAWKSDYTSDELAARGKKSGNSCKEFYKTEQGKKLAEHRGKENSKLLKAFFETEQGKENRRKSAESNRQLMTSRILAGTFTPNSNNRNTHWDSSFKGKKYRSSWEALYQYFYPTDEHETLRIQYPFEGKTLIYIVDFINRTANIVTEVKPRELCNDAKTVAKLHALQEWCDKNCYTLRIADLAFLLTHPKPSNFDEFDPNTQLKIKALYE